MCAKRRIKSACVSRSLIRVFVVRLKKRNILSYPKERQWRFWSDCANAQADLNLRWAHISEGTFSHFLANFSSKASRLTWTYHTCNYWPLSTLYYSRPWWLSWMRRPTGDQEVAGSTPAEVGNILSWRLIMKYFLRSFSPFRWFKKGNCQFLVKECAQYWLTA